MRRSDGWTARFRAGPTCSGARRVGHGQGLLVRARPEHRAAADRPRDELAGARQKLLARGIGETLADSKELFPFLSWFQLYDWPENEYQALRYGGLRQIDGSPKPSYDVFHDLLVARMVQH